MAFKIEHGSLESIGGLARQAGAATQKAKEQEQVRQFTFAKALQEQDLQNTMRLAAYRQELDLEASKMAQAWEVQKAMLNSQADFQRIQAKKNAEFELMTKKQLQRQDEQDNKVRALDQAKQDGRLSSEEYNRALVELQTGIRTEKMDPMQQYMSDLLGQKQGGGEGMAPVRQPDTVIDGVPYFMDEQGQFVDESGNLLGGKAIADMSLEELGQVEIPPRPGMGQTPNLQKIASQPAYTTVGWGPMKKQVPNIPVMKANLELAVDDPDLTPEEKSAVQQAVLSGDPKVIESFYNDLQAVWEGVTPLQATDITEIPDLESVLTQAREEVQKRNQVKIDQINASYDQRRLQVVQDSEKAVKKLLNMKSVMRRGQKLNESELRYYHNRIMRNAEKKLAKLEKKRSKQLRKYE